MSLMAIMLMIVVMVIMMITQMINENAKLGGRWSTAKERKDWKKERWLQSGRS